MKNYKRTTMKIFISIICLFLFMFYIYRYNKEYNYGYKITLNYNGIKYQSNNIDSSTPVKIVIDGVYKKKHGTEDYMFEGDIIIDEELCYENEFAFNEYNMSSLENNSFKAMFFISDKMEEITIKILEPNGRDGLSFSYDGGWLISAPSNTRDEAVDVSNRLIRQLHKDIIIK